MDYQLLIMFGALAGLVAYNQYVEDIKKKILLAFTISTSWVYLTGMYTFKEVNYILFGLNLFPLISWGGGLVLLHVAYEAIKKRTKNAFQITTALYLSGVVLFEYIGYNFLSIQRTGLDNGLIGLPLMHMPWYGQFFYLIIGPAYIYMVEKVIDR